MADKEKKSKDRESVAPKESNPTPDKPKAKVQTPPPKSRPSSTPSREEEILAILQVMRSEQKKTNERLDAYDRRFEQMENAYDDYYEGEVDEYYDDSASYSHKRSAEALDDQPTPGPSHQSSLFSGMAKRFKTVEICDNDIDPVLAENVNELFIKGMDEDQYIEMVKDEINPRPANCEGLATVKLNQLVWDIVSPTARSRDKKLQNIESSIIKSACVLAKTVNNLAKADVDGASKGHIDGINDAIALLGHSNKQINMLRRDLLKPEMRNEYSHLCTHSLPYTRQLFGDDLSKTAKEIEECSKIGYKLQYGSGSGRGSYGSMRPRGPRVRGRGLTRGFRGRPSYQFPKNSQSQRGVGNKRM